jgi:hypothetical protein
MKTTNNNAIVLPLLSTEWWSNVSKEEMVARLERAERFANSHLSLREQEFIRRDLQTVRTAVI